MKTEIFTVYYHGTSSRFKNKTWDVLAASKREAVLKIASKFLDLFPNEEGRYYDCDGHLVCDLEDNSVKYDGGYFEALSEAEVNEK